MGIVGNQPPREAHRVDMEDFHEVLKNMQNQAHEVGVSVAEAVSVYQTMEYERRTNFLIDDGNFLDEHITGIVEALKEIARNMG